MKSVHENSIQVIRDVYFLKISRKRRGKTRMHSSRMRTVRYSGRPGGLVCSGGVGCLSGGVAVCLPGDRGVCLTALPCEQNHRHV